MSNLNTVGLDYATGGNHEFDFDMRCCANAEESRFQDRSNVIDRKPQTIWRREAFESEKLMVSKSDLRWCCPNDRLHRDRSGLELPNPCETAKSVPIFINLAPSCRGFDHCRWEDKESRCSDVDLLIGVTNNAWDQKRAAPRLQDDIRARSWGE